MEKEDFDVLVNKLVALGEDRDEMELWSRMFPELDSAEQAVLVSNLQSELQKLEDVKGATKPD